MSSFKRKSPSAQTSGSQNLHTSGLRHSPTLSTSSIISSGIASLDDIFGGGINLGTTTGILATDPHAAYNQLVLKYFIAEGIALKQYVYIASKTGHELVKSCMWLAKDSLEKQPRHEDEDHEQQESSEVKIAWRYEGMKKFETTVSSTASLKDNDYHVALDLSSQIPTDVLASCMNAGYLMIDEETGNVDTLLSRLKEFLESTKRQSSVPVRIAIPSLGDPWWGEFDSQSIIRFLVRLRLLMRAYPSACAMITLPPYISEESWSSGTGWVERLGWALDACIYLNSFTADSSQSAHLSSHQGLIRILRMPTVNALVSASEKTSTLRGMSTTTKAVRGTTMNTTGVGENNIAFKCTRRRMVFETFHLDVEGGVGERRTTPTSSAVLDGAARPVDAVNVQSKGPSSRSLEVHVDGAITEIPSHDNGQTSKATSTKKVRKKVGFQVDKPDLYDF